MTAVSHNAARFGRVVSLTSVSTRHDDPKPYLWHPLEEASCTTRLFFLDRAIARSLDWAGQYPALSYAAHDSQSLSNGRQVVAAAISSTGVRCVFFSAIGSVLDFTATRDELGRAKTWWYFVQR